MTIRASAPKTHAANINGGRQKSGTSDLPSRIGIIGLGLMGQGIATCLLGHGYHVIGVDADKRRLEETTAHVRAAFAELKRQKLLDPKASSNWKRRLTVTCSAGDLASCGMVIECVREELELKQSIFAELEAIVSPKAVIASNTSSLPISLLQAGRVRPERYIGMHWGEPAQIMRYLEIIPGRQTSKATQRAALKLGISCGKEPAVLKQDIRGFLSNRLMYAMLREACYLVEAGIADVKTVDQSFRNDIGWWALLAGPFRWMDLTGITAYAAVMEGLLPELSNSTEVPLMMQQMVRRKAQGIANRKGFYSYTAASAKKWEQDWVQFTYDMRQLAERYTPAE
jgi:3-hydroxybutyryl-CoA dehydrogenase